MPLPDNEIQDKARQALEQLKGLEEKLKRLRDAAPADLPSRCDETRPFLAPLAELGTMLAEATPSTFAAFITEVGDAAVAAQRNLDRANRELIDEARTQGLSPAGIFQVPKLSAAVKFAVAQTEKNKFGIVFHSRSSSQEERNEQSLTFDIVSVPPPPELLRQTRNLALDVQPVVAAAERRAVLDLLTGATAFLVRGDEVNTAYKETKDEVAKDRDGALVFQMPRTDDDPDRRYLVMFADRSEDPDDADRVGMWEVNTTKGQVRIIMQIASPAKKVNEDMGPLRRWIRQIATRQQALRGPASP